MKNFIHEIHRRSLWQVLGIYLAASWLVLQVVDVIGNNFGLPDWVAPAALILLLLGLPIVLGTAFIQEGMTTREPEVPKQSLADIGEVEPPPPQRPAGGRRIFTWRNALVGGGAAFALLAVLTGGYLFMRTAGIGPAGTLVAKGLLENQATLLLTEFESEDEALSRAATEAIRVDLSQSNVIRIADPGFVSSALERMERSPDARLDPALGRELAEREGMPAIIAGEIVPAGTGYVLTAQIVTTAGGEVLVSDRETAEDDSELVASIDRLSRSLRERIGESLGDLAATPPLERVTTADLDALRDYSRAVALSDRGENQRAADLLEEVVAADTSFAMAWRKLGMLHVSGGGALGDFSRGVEALERAYEFRDRLTERERLLATAGYYGYVDRDPRREADAYERMLENDPDDTWALNNLSLVLSGDLGEFQRAEELLVRVLELED
ncbi:MAG: tetratricopeptide repeat protein, partial [Gemmatimonadota bacterium]|nr:tetratricopeptide repeat protein [Gemmatimonadota bacterium]